MRKTLERIDTLLRGGFTQREQLRAGQVAAGIRELAVAALPLGVACLKSLASTATAFALQRTTVFRCEAGLASLHPEYRLEILATMSHLGIKEGVNVPRCGTIVVQPSLSAV